MGSTPRAHLRLVRGAESPLAALSLVQLGNVSQLLAYAADTYPLHEARCSTAGEHLAAVVADLATDIPDAALLERVLEGARALLAMHDNSRAARLLPPATDVAGMDAWCVLVLAQRDSWRVMRARQTRERV